MTPWDEKGLVYFIYFYLNCHRKERTGLWDIESSEGTLELNPKWDKEQHLEC